jgi:hypothetical protein
MPDEFTTPYSWTILGCLQSTAISVKQREHFCGGTEERNVVRRQIAIPIKATENWQNRLNAHTHLFRVIALVQSHSHT